tara:strand:- start:2013 stop:2144 length:132 start_codon:yes stop_codon:yes gene_type:complete
LYKEINLGKDLEDIVKILTRKKSCKIIKNTIDRDVDKNNRRKL